MRQALIIRCYSAVSFTSQVFRIPVAYLLVKHINSLDIYFIVTSLSMPAQYLASEVFQYRKINWRNIDIPEKISFAILIATIVYVVFTRDILVSSLSIFYTLSLMIAACFAYSLRIKCGATIFLSADALLNVLITLVVVVLSAFSSESLLSYYLVCAYTLINALYAITSYSYLRQNKYKMNQMSSPESSKIEYKNRNVGLLQLLLMFTMHLQRVLISILWPTLLGIVSIVSNITMGWKRMVLDDAVFLEKINIKPFLISNIVKDSFRTYFIFSIPMIILSFVIFVFSKLDISLFNKCINLHISTLTPIVMLLILYFASLPSGIIATNLIRTGDFLPSRLSVCFIVFLQLIIILALLLEYFYFWLVPPKFIWIIIFLTVSINIVLFNDYLFFHINGSKVELFTKSTLFYLLCSFILLLMVKYGM